MAAEVDGERLCSENAIGRRVAGRNAITCRTIPGAPSSLHVHRRDLEGAVQGCLDQYGHAAGAFLCCGVPASQYRIDSWLVVHAKSCGEIPYHCGTERVWTEFVFLSQSDHRRHGMWRSAVASFGCDVLPHLRRGAGPSILFCLTVSDQDMHDSGSVWPDR